MYYTTLLIESSIRNTDASLTGQQGKSKAYIRNIFWGLTILVLPRRTAFIYVSLYFEFLSIDLVLEIAGFVLYQLGKTAFNNSVR
jgi:hypothetical protein